MIYLITTGMALVVLTIWATSHQVEKGANMPYNKKKNGKGGKKK